MEKNNKGFMMVELLVVAVVVLLIFTVMIVNFVPTKGEYEKRLEYNDIDILYTNYYMRVLMLRHFNTGTKKLPTLNNGYLQVVENKTCKNNYNFTNEDGVNISCQELVDKFGITDVVITKYNPNKSTSYNGPLKEYINYLDIEDGSEVYRITTKTTEGYSSSKFYSKVCGEPSYGPWSKYTKEECTVSDICEKSYKDVNLFDNGKMEPTNLNSDQFYYKNGENYIIVTYPCTNNCNNEMYLYRTREKTIEEKYFEEQNFSVTPCG